MLSRFRRSTAIALLAALPFAAAQAGAQDVAAPVIPTVHVSGEGRVSGVPDMATIRLGVEARAATPGEAVAAMNSPMSELLETLLGAGIDPRDIQTSDLSLRPVYGDREDPLGDGRVITGYQASNGVSVQVRALDSLGTVLDDAVSVGSNRFDGLSFGLTDPLPAEDAALAAAVADAMRKAAIVAEAAGAELGPVLQVTEQGATVEPAPMMRAQMESDMAIAPGSVDTTARVSVTFQLEP